MSAFARCIGIDYSGAETLTASVRELRVYMAEGNTLPERAVAEVEGWILGWRKQRSWGCGVTAMSNYGVSFPISGPVVIAISRKLVGVAGFEPATPSSRTRCSI